MHAPAPLVRPVLLLAAVLLAAPAAARGPAAGTIRDGTVSSAALAGNAAGDASARRVLVYLPPSYATAKQRRYPVLYLLHGLGSDAGQWVHPAPAWNVRDAIDRAIRAGAIGEVIVVMPDAHNVHGGGFFVNSPSTGNWEDFVVRDLVAHVDRTYRTRAGAASRGIAGHSMGGYGAIRLAMRHPDVFGAVYAMSACCLAWEGDLLPDEDAWDRAIAWAGAGAVPDALGELDDFRALAFLALSAAWSPDPARPPLRLALPFERRGDGRVPIADPHARWSANMPVYLVDASRTALARLRGIGFDVGTRDEFTHIPAGNRALARALARNGIAHAFEEYDGDHNREVPARFEQRMLPFFAAKLAGAAPHRP